MHNRPQTDTPKEGKQRKDPKVFISSLQHVSFPGQRSSANNIQTGETFHKTQIYLQKLWHENLFGTSK